jgi:hypothetical protein
MLQKKELSIGLIVGTAFLVVLCGSPAYGQAMGPFRNLIPPAVSSPAAPVQTIPLTVPKGAPIRIAIEKEVSIKKVGQSVQGRVVDPVYAFDQLVVPVGSEVRGKIIRLEKVSKGRRTQAIMNGDFTPLHIVKIEFDELVLKDGKTLPLKTIVSPGTALVVRLLTSHDNESNGKGAAAREVQEAKKEIRREWDNAMAQIEAPGKMHRIKRIVVAELPYHPQYIDAGARYDAELLEPLDFGTETCSADALAAFGTSPPPGSIVHAQLVTPLNSAMTQKNAPVQAIISQPLFTADHHLILPEGARLEGSVVQVKPARKLERNGQLRIVFHKLELPSGMAQKVDGSLEGVEVDRAQNLTLDSEGGARTTTPKKRYLTTGISIALAASSMSPDRDAGRASDGGAGDPGNRTLSGGSGFRLVGAVSTYLIHSRPLASSLGIYGASMSIYSHFLARGRDVVFPKDTPMDIGFGTHESAKPNAPASQPVPVPATPPAADKKSAGVQPTLVTSMAGW